MIELASTIALSSPILTELTGNGWPAVRAGASNQTGLTEQLAANSHCRAASRRALEELALTDRSSYLIGQIGELGPAFRSPRLLASALAAGSRANRTGALAGARREDYEVARYHRPTLPTPGAIHVIALLTSHLAVFAEAASNPFHPR